MLRKGRAEHDAHTKVQLMMEFVTTDKLGQMPSPRTLNAHLPFSMLPVAEVKAKRVRVVHVYRNPKDTCVSLYHMARCYPMPLPLPTNTFAEFFEHFFFGTRRTYRAYLPLRFQASLRRFDFFDFWKY